MKRSELHRNTPLVAKTPLRRKAGLNVTRLARSSLPAAEPGAAGKPVRASRPRDTGPSPQQVAQVRLRDEEACVRCGGACHGERGRDWSVQHRRARGVGGTRRPDANEPQNLILLCGSATSAGGCHAHVESRRAEARDHGWAIRQSDDPLQVPVWHWQRGLIFLDAGGGWSSRPPTAEEA